MSSTDLVTMTADVADKMKPGDRVTGTGISSSDVVTVLNITDGTAKQFRASQNVSISSGVTLTFREPQYYQWELSTSVDLIKKGMSVTGSGQLESNTTISDYKDSIKIFENTKKEETIIKHLAPFSNTVGYTPTITRGEISTQAGYVIFNQQQRYALAGQGLRIGGYGTNEVLRLYGYEIELSDLKIALTPMTTTTTAAVTNSTTVNVTLQNGILPSGVSSVSGIGIDSTTVAPTVSLRAGAINQGNLTLSAAQTLEKGASLTFTGSGQVATITGKIKILKTGTSNQAIRFDIEKLLTIT